MRKTNCLTEVMLCRSAILVVGSDEVEYSFGPRFVSALYYHGGPGEYIVGEQYEVTYEENTGKVNHLCHMPKEVQ